MPTEKFGNVVHEDALAKILYQSESESTQQKLKKIIYKFFFYTILAIIASMIGNALIGSATLLESVLYSSCGMPPAALGWSIFRSYRQLQPPLPIRFFSLIFFIVLGSALGTMMFEDWDAIPDVCRSSGLGSCIEAMVFSIFEISVMKYREHRLLNLENVYSDALSNT